MERAKEISLAVTLDMGKLDMAEISACKLLRLERRLVPLAGPF
jgi:hypothetical protein